MPERIGQPGRFDARFDSSLSTANGGKHALMTIDLEPCTVDSGTPELAPIRGWFLGFAHSPGPEGAIMVVVRIHTDPVLRLVNPNRVKMLETAPFPGV